MNGCWEKAGPELVRIAVPGGWLYRLLGTPGICFVPNPWQPVGVNPPPPEKQDALARIEAELEAELAPRAKAA